MTMRKLKKKKINKGKMARGLVYFCISVLTIVLIWAMCVKTFSDAYVDLTDILTFAASVFGGELLMLLAKRLFAKPNDNDNDINNDGGLL